MLDGWASLNVFRYSSLDLHAWVAVADNGDREGFGEVCGLVFVGGGFFDVAHGAQVAHCTGWYLVSL